jgi:hypothetical protein
VPLETATYIVSLVVTNPDGSDQRNSADDHIRLLKACLKRTLPLLDGAVSLSHTQLMRLNDVSASVQLQLNTLRDGSATVYNALYANSASFAVNSNNALSLGGFAAATYPRLSVANTFTARQTIAVGGEVLRLAGQGSDYIAWWNAAQSIRYGYIQMVVGGNLIVNNEQGGSTAIQILTGTGGVTINGGTAWHSGNDGSGSGLDADLLDGRQGSELANGSTAALRTAAGYLFAVYLNQSSSDAENPNFINVMVTTGDGFLRKATNAYFGSQISARNISNKGGTSKTLSSAAPSGGSDGDIWYQT